MEKTVEKFKIKFIGSMLIAYLMMSISANAQTASQSDEVWFETAKSVAEISGERANTMGIQFYNGTNNFAKDVSKAIQLFEIGAKKHNYSHCYYNLANIYGPESEYVNLPKSVTCYKKCVELFPTSASEYKTSLYNLGYIYQNGGPGLKRNLSSAIYWYKKSLATGDGDAALRLAYIYAHGGVGVPQDTSKFKTYVFKAADYGIEEAIMLKNDITHYGVDKIIEIVLRNNYK